MNDEQLLRYSRHLLLPEIGVEGQERLRAASALIIGAGGLGCPAALYLAASGFGRLTVADPDEVDLTNLQRQVLYTAQSVGKRKVDEASAALARLNPEVEVSKIPSRLGAEELDQLVSRSDVVLDCSDNFATRHAVNRACVMHRKPLVSGAAIRFDAQLAVFDLRSASSPCYSCVFPEEGEIEEVRCSVMGVLAPLTGVIGAAQALEAIKIVSGAGQPLAGLLIADALKGEWRRVRVAKDPACRACGASPA
ncbi:MAG: molybdopterin-synthase adenylyltransferase MoeB [Betaproteobacteria bacterium]|nr:molybdopterin-synthase adenylyltransferase MoeB [Betaproteobacteria bacterium]